MPHATAPDGTEIYFETHGDPANPAVFLGPHFYPSAGEIFASFGMSDPAQEWIDLLAGDFHLVLADWPRGMGKTGGAIGMDFTPDVAVADLTAVLDGAGIDRAAWIGYSYGGAVGMQLACRADRLWAVVIGGFPPLNAPFELMVEITTDAAKNPSPQALAVASEATLWSSVGFYTPLATWDERAEVAKLAIPRMVFMGTEDTGAGPEGASALDLAGDLRQVEDDLRDLGWTITWIEGAGHMDAVTVDAAGEAVRSFLLDTPS